MTIRIEPKRVSEIRDYTHDWTPFLGDTDTISSQTTTATGCIVDSSSVLAGQKQVKFWVSGGVGGVPAKITQTILTSAGRTEAELFLLPIEAAEEPVSVEEAKVHLRIVDDTSQDALIASYISSARAYVENESGYAFVKRQFLDVFSYWPPNLILSYNPVVSIDEILYLDTYGVSQTYNDYILGFDGRLIPVSSWPSGTSVSVRYTAGFDEGDASFRLELARQAILLLVTSWFDNRSTINSSQIPATEVPFGARAIIDRFRVQVC